MTVPDPIAASCSTDYLPAVHDSGTRPLSAIRLEVLHDEEAATAQSAAEYFRDPKSGGSAHRCVDDQTCYRTLTDNMIPWGARSAPQLSVNTHGMHLEQAGFTKWSAVIWLSHLRTLKRAAYKTALDSKRYGFPTVFLTAADLVAGARSGTPARGVTTHREVTAASKVLDPANAWKYDHTDPGPLWPRRLFMRYVRQYRAELS